MLTKLVFAMYREDGGNYQKIEREHIIMDDQNIYCAIKEKTTTREDMPGDRYEILIFQDGEFRLVDEKKANEETIVRVEGNKVVIFRAQEAKIVYQRPRLFIQSRKHKAQQLVDTARAFGHLDDY